MYAIFISQIYVGRGSRSSACLLLTEFYTLIHPSTYVVYVTTEIRISDM